MPTLNDFLFKKLASTALPVLTFFGLLLPSVSSAEEVLPPISSSEEVLPSISSSEEALPSISRSSITGCFSQDGEKLSSETVCLFDDGSFYYPMLLNLTGTYKIKDNKVIFHPNQYETFEVYGRVDPTLETGTHFNFTGFNFDSLIDFNGMGFNYMPIDDISCHWRPKVDVYDHPKRVSNFSLAYVPDDGQAYNTMITLKFRPPSELNDFLLVYHRPDISDTHAIILTDGTKDGQLWLLTGKNQLSMSKINMPAKELSSLQKIGHKVSKSGGRFPKMIDQDNNLTMQNPDGYFVDKITNNLYPNPNQPEKATGWSSYVDKSDTKNKAHFLKVYNKVDAISQSMTEAIVEQRPRNNFSNCL